MRIAPSIPRQFINLVALVNRSYTELFYIPNRLLMCELLTNSLRISLLKLEDFQLEGVLGEGSYGFVLLAVWDRQEYALKEMSKYRLKKFHKQHIALVEKEILRKVAHPGIISAYGAFQTHFKLYIVLEACKGGEFQQFVKRGICQDARRFYFAQLVNIVEYLHSNGIVHRNLKPSNLLLTEQGHLKMIDFGTACVVNCTLISQAFKDSLCIMRKEKENIQQQLQESPKIRKRKSTFVGTSEYMSPQLLELNQCQATSDLWSLGCILYFLYYTRGHFYDVCELDLYKKIRYGKVNFPKNQFVTDEVEDLIRKLLMLNPQQRLESVCREDLTFKNLKAHPFFKGINVDNIFSQKPPAYQNLETQIESKLTQLNNTALNYVSVSDKCLLTLFLAKKKYNIYIIYRCQFYSDLIIKQFQQKYPQKVPIIYKLKKQQGKYKFAEDICPGKIKVNIQTQQNQSKLIYQTTDSALNSARLNQLLFGLEQLEGSLEKMQINLE